MRVGIVQYRARPGDPEGSRAELVGLAGQAARDVDLVVLPEMAAAGYAFPDAGAVRKVAEAPDGPSAAAYAPVARANRCWLVAGFPELAGDRLFNSALVLDPAGQLAFVYRKTLLYDADLPWATPGDSGYRAFDTDNGRFGVGICMDLNDDGFVGWTAGANLDAIAFPTNWVEPPTNELHTWMYWAWRLIGQDTALVAANTWGRHAMPTRGGGTEPGPLAFTGESAVLHQGRILASLPRTGNGAARAVVTRTKPVR